MSSSTEIPDFVWIWQKKHGCHGQFLFLICWKWKKNCWLRYFQIICNLVQMMFLMFSTNIHHFILIWQETWLLWALISFYWLKHLTCSVKLLVSMVCNLIQMMYVKFSTKIPHFVKIVWNIWSSLAILFFSLDFLHWNF